MTEPVVLAGSYARELLPAVAHEVGAQAHAHVVERFPDGEIRVEVPTAVARREVFILQSLVSPAGEAALELLLLADAAWRAGALRVSAVIPYLGYARQDRRTEEGQPLGAKVVARVVDLGHFAHVVAVDVHAPAVTACFDGRIEHVTAVPALVEALRKVVSRDAVVVSPDLGAVKLAERYARALGVPLAVVHKVRTSPTEVAAHGVVGDVDGREPVIVDDMISTGATVVAAVQALRERGCTRRPIIAATHGLFVADALQRLRALEPIRVVVTDSVPREAASERAAMFVVSLAPLLARTIRALHRREPVGDLLSHA